MDRITVFSVRSFLLLMILLCIAGLAGCSASSNSTGPLSNSEVIALEAVYEKSFDEVVNEFTLSSEDIKRDQGMACLLSQHKNRNIADESFQVVLCFESPSAKSFTGVRMICNMPDIDDSWDAAKRIYTILQEEYGDPNMDMSASDHVSEYILNQDNILKHRNYLTDSWKVGSKTQCTLNVIHFKEGQPYIEIIYALHYT